MTPEQEDALIASVYDKKFAELSLDESIRLAIRAAVAAERERCARAIEAINSETGWIGKKEAARAIRREP